jgi:hypothetical protein
MDKLFKRQTMSKSKHLNSNEGTTEGSSMFKAMNRSLPTKYNNVVSK